MAKNRAAEAAEAVETEQVGNSTAEPERAGNGAAGEATGTEEVVYSAAEFARAAAKVLDKPYSPDIVIGAFKMAGKTTATKAQAAEIISKFLKKEVKLK